MALPYYSTLLPEGPYVTGCLDLMHGRNKDGTFLRLFYPAAISNIKEHQSQFTPWFLGEEYTNGLSKVVFPKFPSLYKWLFNWQSRPYVIPSVWEAPISDGKFPLVVFSHGWAGSRSVYSIVCNNLSSFGFVVACLEHRDGSASSTFTLSDNGERIWNDCEPVPSGVNEYNFRKKQIDVRVAECDRALNLFQKLNQGDKITNEIKSNFDLSTLKNKFDMSKLVVAGHSFGACTAIKSLAENDKYKICVALDPWMLPVKGELEELHTKINRPILSILTESFVTKNNMKALDKVNNGKIASILLKGTIHHGQSDIAYVLGVVGQIIGRLSSQMDRETTLRINNDLVLNFICQHLDVKQEVPDLDVNFLQKLGKFNASLNEYNFTEVDDFLKHHNIAQKNKQKSKM